MYYRNDTKNEIVTLIRIACNSRNSHTLREIASEHLAQKVLNAPDLAAFAAEELFAKCDTGTPAATVFDALLKLISHARYATSTLFRDAIDAVSSSNKKARTAAASRVLDILGMRNAPLRRKNASSVAA